MKYFKSNVEIRLGDRAAYRGQPVYIIGLPPEPNGPDLPSDEDEEEEDEYPRGISIAFEKRDKHGDGCVMEISPREQESENLRFLSRDVLSDEIREWLKERFNIDISPEPAP